VFFSYGLVLTKFYGVADRGTGLYLLAMAASNFLGPLLLGPLFDTVGRRIMITLAYAAGGVLLIAAAIGFGLGVFSAWTQTFALMAVFFFASAGASSAYLTASEIFPLETRALAIATFYAVGTAVGGIVAPLLFGVLLASRSPWPLVGGYGVAAVLMLGAAAVEAKYGIDAEGRSLEQIAEPLSSA
jgi:MFS family permease